MYRVEREVRQVKMRYKANERNLQGHAKVKLDDISDENPTATNFRLTSGENSGVNQLFQYDMVLLTKIKKKLDQVNPKLILLTGILLFELNL